MPGAASPSPLFGSSAPNSAAAGPSNIPLPLPPLAPATPSPFTPVPPATPAPAGIGGSPGSPSVLPPPIFAQGAGSTPLSPLGGAPAPSTAAGPSDFTRMISKAPAPVVPDAPPAPAAGSANAGAATATKPATGKRGIPTGLIIVINAVILVAVLIVVFVLKKPAPTIPAKPAVPTATAPQLPAPKP